jgi:hypothetical protein
VKLGSTNHVVIVILGVHAHSAVTTDSVKEQYDAANCLLFLSLSLTIPARGLSQPRAGFFPSTSGL